LKQSDRILIAVLVAIATLTLAAELLMPRLIDAAYRRESAPFLNRLITGRTHHSLDYYQRLALVRARYAAGLGASLTLLVGILLQPRVARRLLAWFASRDPRLLESDPPPRLRRVAVYTVGAVLVVGSLGEISISPPADREHWPFSPYPMYASLTPASLTVRRLFGVTRETPPREIPLFEPRFIRPFDNSRLSHSLNRMRQSPDRERLLREALSDCLRRYEAQRRVGRHNGPPLSRVRLYELHWETLDSRARNREAPERRELLFEVTSRNPDDLSS
jgi:hypothetical protein